MHGQSFVAVIAAGLALVLMELVPVGAAAEDVATAGQPADSAGTTKPLLSSPSSNPTPSPDAPAPETATPALQSGAAQPVPPADPVIASIRSKLGDAALRKATDAKDLAALEAFYAERSDPPVWITSMGFSAKAQEAINEISKADDWGLSASAFELPPAGDLPDSADDQAIAEIKLQLAVLKYARFARGGRVDPATLSAIIDQAPPLLDPKVCADRDRGGVLRRQAYLQSLHPKHEQFQRLRQALLKARGIGGDAAAKKPRNEQEIQRILINMERWRWMPLNLGTVYVQDNVPEFMLYVVKNGKTIHSDKIAVGELTLCHADFLRRHADHRIQSGMDGSPIRGEGGSAAQFAEWRLVRRKLDPAAAWTTGEIQRPHGRSRQHQLEQREHGEHCLHPASGAEECLGQSQIPLPEQTCRLYARHHQALICSSRRYAPSAITAFAWQKPSRLAEILLKEDKGWDAQKVEDLIDKGYDSA